jgi:hypothetical protein
MRFPVWIWPLRVRDVLRFSCAARLAVHGHLKRARRQARVPDFAWARVYFAMAWGSRLQVALPTWQLDSQCANRRSESSLVAKPESCQPELVAAVSLKCFEPDFSGLRSHLGPPVKALVFGMTLSKLLVRLGKS